MDVGVQGLYLRATWSVIPASEIPMENVEASVETAEQYEFSFCPIPLSSQKQRLFLKALPSKHFAHKYLLYSLCTGAHDQT